MRFQGPGARAQENYRYFQANICVCYLDLVFLDPGTWNLEPKRRSPRRPPLMIETKRDQPLSCLKKSLSFVPASIR